MIIGDLIPLCQVVQDIDKIFVLDVDLLLYDTVVTVGVDLSSFLDLICVIDIEIGQRYESQVIFRRRLTAKFFADFSELVKEGLCISITLLCDSHLIKEFKNGNTRLV